MRPGLNMAHTPTDRIRQLIGNTKSERIQRENSYSSDGLEVIRMQKRKQRLGDRQKIYEEYKEFKNIYEEGPGMDKVACHIEGRKFRFSFSCCKDF